MLHHELESWKDATFAAEWAGQDVLGGLLRVPRRLAAVVVAHTRPEPRLIIDVASGPGAFLEVFLDEFPDARGVWTDGSPAMEEQARANLARFGDRVEYRLVDMTELGEAGLPADADVVLSSRASHHLDPQGLVRFYGQVEQLLAPGGWVANLDHTGRAERWVPIHQAVLRSLVGERPPRPGHVHDHPAPTVTDHLTAIRAAGFDADVVWSAGRTVLLQGVAPGPTETGSSA